MNKQIIFTGKGKAELLDSEFDEPPKGCVRVKVVRSCISSGTERANIVGLPNRCVGIGISKNPDDTVSWPRVSGYSTSGFVDAVGEDVEGLKVGDRVAMSWTLHRQYATIPAEQAYLIPDDVSFQDAAFTHISTFPMAAIRKCRLEIGEGAIVMGQGILGQLAVILLKAAGAAPVIAADPVAEKRAQALAIGADAALDPTAEDFADKARELCGCSRFTASKHYDCAGPQVAIEVTGNGKALDNALDAIAPFGRIALLGCTRDSNFTIDYYHKVHGRGVTLIGAHTLARPKQESSSGYWTTRDDARTFIRLLSLRRFSLDALNVDVHSPLECGEVYARLASGKPFPTTQFDWTTL
ncbi:MAG: zinc-binding dehydrogenase [Victivallales bacterium]|nr:zinc-binding dehydrogenase [Victivallales bacterium]